MMSRSFSSDQELIDRLASNDTDAFEELYRRYWYTLYSYSQKKLQSSDDARRLVREIFIDLWENRKTWPIDFSISRHLYSIVRKKVVVCLNDKLSDVGFAEILERKFAPEFTPQALRIASAPSIKKYTAYKPPVGVQAPVIKMKSHKHHKLASMKWIFQLVTARLHN